MSVESKIIENSNDKLTALAPRAAKAVKNPDTGVEIKVKGAYYVIRDCAQMTVAYLPVFLYGNFEDPIKSLSGKFTKKEFESFVSRSTSNVAIKQLCNIMLLDARDKPHIIEQKEPVYNETEDDVYGDYGSDNVTEEKDDSNFSSNDANSIIKVLCKAFKAK